MGCLNSKPSYIEHVAGGEKEYQERFLESKTLGEGEFGVVKLVHDVKAKDLIQTKPLAVKYLRKGYTFKDNTLYSPLKKEVLQGEVEILRQLNGEVRKILICILFRHGGLLVCTCLMYYTLITSTHLFVVHTTHYSATILNSLLSTKVHP